jgi:purine-nucleoside phosphorylase
MTSSFEAPETTLSDVRAAAAAVRAKTPHLPPPEVGLVLGSGLSGLADEISNPTVIPYSEIPNFPLPHVQGHRGTLALGTFEGLNVACLAGRVHLYEGHPPSRVVFGVRVLAELGCRVVLLTNAAGGITSELGPGDLMLIKDHLNLTGQNPLMGPADESGPRFPDMSCAYDRELRELARLAARKSGVRLNPGIYAGVLGPSYETPAEIRMLANFGANAVGMSTVSEVIALRHRGVRVGAVSVITNYAAGRTDRPLNHEEVEQIAASARDKLTRFLRAWLGLIREDLSGG